MSDYDLKKKQNKMKAKQKHVNVIYYNSFWFARECVKGEDKRSGFFVCVFLFLFIFLFFLQWLEQWKESMN